MDGKGERLSASKLKRHADALIGLLDCAKWAKTQSWQPFMLLPTGSCIAGAGQAALFSMSDDRTYVLHRGPAPPPLGPPGPPCFLFFVFPPPPRHVGPPGP